ncbi:DUF456 domain-containing protein [Parafrankia sp. EUN1f]|uniref:DUF456 domain-containing protein n=1 Tax=Parafrankia sp. EUN1f TaxID=102897 RepID=UPI0001C4748F|nr:DUF456 domain-containing protein [Parafrankia sp. EUN1f]EFC79978.1 protein of unknown function DUF456 [Parafrankia sp. EUN1f]
MSGVELLAVALVMAVGVVGVVVPVLPGLLLVWGAGVWWTIADGGGPGRWAVLAVMSALFVAGSLAKYVLPGRAASASGAPIGTMLVGAVCAVVGFFVVPVVGLLVGGLAGIYLAELARLRDPVRAGASTWAATVAIGVGLLVEICAGLAMAAVWGLGELVT